jgi:hypothetical protein
MMKEVFGMQLDNTFYENIVETIQISVNELFGGEVKVDLKQVNFANRGYFKIKYKYIPLQYDIIIENEGTLFTIDIFDSEGAKNTLYRINKFDNNLNFINVQEALKLLKKVLNENDFCFYVYKEKKLYKKMGNCLKRIKDLSELNGR